MIISFTAYGTPAPKGSTKAFYRPGMRFPIVTEDNKHTRPWAAIVRDAAQILGGPGSPITFQREPISLYIHFFMPRPKSLPKKCVAHVKRPDLDKLVRAVKDALTGIVWCDDSQVVNLHAAKDYVQSGEMARAEIKVQSVKIELF